ncbi:MAG: hypothetical protein IT222_00795 [Crocinitomix sp.]|nr:hypothetical protein [Crocinitomix sp.]
MKNFLILFLSLFYTSAFCQVENRFGIEIGATMPDLSFKFRTKFKLNDVLDVELGVGLNKSNTLDRSVGFNIYLGNWESTRENKIRSIMLSAVYSNMTSGIFNYQEGGNSGSYLTNNNQYLAPKVGLRVYQKNIFIENVFLNDLSISIGAMYLFPFDNHYIILRNGTPSSQVENLLIQQAQGGLNVFFNITGWFGK